MSLDNYQGQLLIAQPKCITNFFAKGTILIARHSDQGAWGVIVNRVFNKMESGLSVIMEQVGIEHDDSKYHPLYVGGPVETNKINVIHTLDWASNSTMHINAHIGITCDISVLTAIAANEGPEHFRACVGMCGWGPGQLEGEMAGLPPWLPEHRWLHAPSSISNIFEFQEGHQWQNAIHEAARETTKAWF